MKRLMECGFFSFGIDVNDHKGSCETIEEHMERPWCDFEDIVSGSSVEKMVESETMIRLQIYPRTSVGSVCFIGHDIDGVIEEALGWAKRNFETIARLPAVEAGE